MFQILRVFCNDLYLLQKAFSPNDNSQNENYIETERLRTDVCKMLFQQGLVISEKSLKMSPGYCTLKGTERDSD